MNKKFIIICTAVLALLLAVIAAGVFVLYSGNTSAESSILPPDHSEALTAVPTDAAVVMSFTSFEKCASLLDDTTTPMPALVCCQSGAFRSFLKDVRLDKGLKGIKGARTVVSLHNSGKLTPLLIVDVSPAASSDTSEALAAVLELVGSHSLYASLEQSSERRFFICSPSETVLNSSSRHLEEGHNILEDKDFFSLLEKVSDRNVLFLSNLYAPRLMESLFARKVSSKSSFFKSAADWTSLSFRESSDGVRFLAGDCVYGRGASYFMNVLSAHPCSESHLPEILPSATVSAISFTCSKDDDWRGVYEKYVDANTKMQGYRNACDSIKAKMGQDPRQWVTNCREVATACWISADGSVRKANFYRMNKQQGSEEAIEEWKGAGMAAALFGQLFNIGDESGCISAGEWLVTGSVPAVSDWKEGFSSSGSLASRMDRTETRSLFSGKDCAMAAYFSATDAAAMSEELYKEPLLSSMREYIKDADFAPLFVTYAKGVFNVASRTVCHLAGGNGTSGLKTGVEVPAGPFKVKNCLSGKENTFYQNENMYLCLKDEKGKGLWGVPFSEPLCGRVENIDYYANGKIQFLFAAGSKIYLISRLGGFVSGFPVDLHKDVLLGPAAYDFTGAHGYSILVLHTDNTIEMYNLKGRKPAEWKGITAGDTITGLPELEKRGEGRYWKVPTAGGDLFFDFWGGDPVKEKNLK